jgi:hypothetical protein
MSKVEVNTIEPQCGTTLTVGKCTTSVAVPGNVVKSNALQASDGGNIVSQSGTDITLGASGDTVALASGATQSGFGASGAVTYDTTPKTATFTAASGSGYFCDTSGGAFTVNLPAGAAGSIVTVVDYTRTFNTYNLTIAPDGSEKVGGVAADTALEVNGQSATFVYVDSTEGWINTQDTQTSITGQTFVAASGGNCTCTCGNFKIHKFTAPGTLCVSVVGNAAGSNTVDYLVVAGGGGGGVGPGPSDRGGGAGGGGYRESSGAASGDYTASPLGSGVSALPVSVTAYPITVGGGGAGGTAPSKEGVAGSNSIFSTITSAGGGGGGGGPSGNCLATDGGSGGGGGGGCGTAKSGGLGNVPSVSPSQGNDGGEGGGPSCTSKGGGGGGATVAGSPVPAGLDGGTGGQTSISTAATFYSGGGGGSGGSCGGCGGGGGPAVGGTTNTGGGGGGTIPSPAATAGGSGIVYIRYRYQ